MSIVIPRAEDILASRPGFSPAEIKELAHDLYLKGTLDHVPMQLIGYGLVEKWHPDTMEWVNKRHGERRYERDDLYTLVGAPDEYAEDAPSNLLLNNGITSLLNRLIGNTGSFGAYANGTARVGVGTATAVEVATQTDLQAAAGTANRFFQPCAASYPQVTGSPTTTMTSQSTFGTADGNFAWQEWGVDGGGASGNATVGTNGASNAALLNRKVASLGTKASGSTWTITTNITIS